MAGLREKLGEGKEAGVAEAAKEKVQSEQSSRSDMIKSMAMPEAPVNKFMGMSEDELAKVDMKKLAEPEAKAWAEAMEAARKAKEEKPVAPPPAPMPALPPAPPPPPVAEQPTEVTGVF